MRPVKKTYTGTGAQAWIPVNYLQRPFSVAVAVIVNSGSATYTVEHTHDQVMLGETARAFPHALLTSKTASDDGGYDTPVQAIRLNLAANSGSVDFIVTQGA